MVVALVWVDSRDEDEIDFERVTFVAPDIWTELADNAHQLQEIISNAYPMIWMNPTDLNPVVVI